MRGKSNLRKAESGQVLIFVVLALALSLIILPPLLSFGFGANRSSQIRQERMKQLYAADAGIQDAYMKIKTIGGNYTADYIIGAVNGYDVHVVVANPGFETYDVTSTASTPPTAGITRSDLIVTSHTGLTDYAEYLSSALISRGNIGIQPGSVVNGNVTLNGTLDNKGTINCGGGLTNNQCVKSNAPAWPTHDELWDWYSGNVSGHPYGNNTFPASGDPTVVPSNGQVTVLAPCEYTPADGTLNIDGPPVGQAYGNFTLNGTLYVHGGLTFSKKKDGSIPANINVYLNGHTLYSTGDLIIKDPVTLYGPGSVIAEGAITFYPKITPGDTSFIFVLSVNGSVDVQPSGNFYGTLAGVSSIGLAPGNTITWTAPPADSQGNPLLDFPWDWGYELRVQDYIISP